MEESKRVIIINNGTRVMTQEESQKVVEMCGATEWESIEVGVGMSDEAMSELSEVILTWFARRRQVPQVDVYARPECIFKYCPYQDSCKEANSCACPK